MMGFEYVYQMEFHIMRAVFLFFGGGVEGYYMTDSMYMHVCIDRLHIWETCQPKKKEQHFVDLQLIWFTGGPTTLQSLNKKCKEVTSFESYRFV